jgi:hypothetical protein
MTRFKCPKCAAVINADQAQGSEVTACPQCGVRLRLRRPEPAAAKKPAAPPSPPQGSPPDEPRLAITPEAPPAWVAPIDDLEEVPAKAAGLPVQEPEEDEAPAPEPVRRKRRKRRRRKGRRSSGSSLDLWLWLGGMGAVTFLGTGLAVQSLFKPATTLAVVGYGIIVMLVGVVWLYFQAIEDGIELIPRPDFGEMGVGFRLFIGIWFSLALMIMFVTAMFYLATNPVRAWKPGTVALLGIVFTFVGFVLLFRPASI